MFSPCSVHETGTHDQGVHEHGVHELFTFSSVQLLFREHPTLLNVTLDFMCLVCRNSYLPSARPCLPLLLACRQPVQHFKFNLYDSINLYDRHTHHMRRQVCLSLGGPTFRKSGRSTFKVGPSAYVTETALAPHPTHLWGPSRTHRTPTPPSAPHTTVAKVLSLHSVAFSVSSFPYFHSLLTYLLPFGGGKITYFVTYNLLE